MSESNLDFNQLKQKIYRYSLKITSNSWDAEDLTQEVLLKVYRAMETLPSRIITNAYLYRIASNTWKDKLKRDKSYSRMSDAAMLESAAEDDALSTRELLEVLSHRLSPRAMVILLLMDVFDFTARETAEFLSSAEGTIQVTLGRARSRLRKLANLSVMDEKPPVKKVQGTESTQLDFNTLVAAFKRRDPKAICSAYIGLIKQQVKISKLISLNGKFSFYLEDPDGNRFMITG